MLGDLYSLYTPRCYLWAVADAFVKFIFVAAIGMIFARAQLTGLVISAIVCVGLGFVSTVYMPFVYNKANYIVLTTYAAIIANCAETAVSYSMGIGEPSKQAKRLHSVLETITLALYVTGLALPQCIYPTMTPEIFILG